MGGRLEEMPGEEGFPSYMGSRLSAFYERAGVVSCIGSPERRGSLTIAGAVSPPGADFSEPVTQSTIRIVDALYSLDVSLANRRHFPAISWLTSYSLYVDAVKDWWNKFDPGWEETRENALKILQKEAELEEIVRLVGPESLPVSDKLLLLVSRMIREDFLQQSAYHEVDTYCTPTKAGLMLKTIIKFYNLSQKMLSSGIDIEQIRSSPIVYKIARLKEIPHDTFENNIKILWAEMDKSLVARRGGI